MRMVRAVAGGVSFLTIVPIAAPVSAESALAFPLAGVIVAACIVGVRVVTQGAGSLLVGALAVAADVVITRGLHYDALADSADGLVAFADPPRRLEVMDDPHLGALGAVALVVVILARVATFGSPRLGVLSVLLACAWSRALMGVVLLEGPSARPSGITSAFQQGASRALRVSSVASLAVLTVVIALVAGDPGLLGLSLGVTVGGLVWLRARATLGGVTGDVIGAIGLVAETMLMVGLVLGVAFTHG